MVWLLSIPSFYYCGFGHARTWTNRRRPSRWPRIVAQDAGRIRPVHCPFFLCFLSHLPLTSRDKSSAQTMEIFPDRFAQNPDGPASSSDHKSENSRKRGFKGDKSSLWQHPSTSVGARLDRFERLVNAIMGKIINSAFTMRIMKRNFHLKLHLKHSQEQQPKLTEKIECSAQTKNLEWPKSCSFIWRVKPENLYVPVSKKMYRFVFIIMTYSS